MLTLLFGDVFESEAKASVEYEQNISDMQTIGDQSRSDLLRSDLTDLFDLGI